MNSNSYPVQQHSDLTRIEVFQATKEIVVGDIPDADAIEREFRNVLRLTQEAIPPDELVDIINDEVDSWLGLTPVTAASTEGALDLQETIEQKDNEIRGLKGELDKVYSGKKVVVASANILLLSFVAFLISKVSSVELVHPYLNLGIAISAFVFLIIGVLKKTDG